MTAKLALFFFLIFSVTASGTNAQQALASVLIDNPFSAPSWRLAASTDGTNIAMSSADDTVTIWTPDTGMQHRKIPFPRRATLSYRARGVAIHPSSERIAFSQPPVQRGDLGPKGARIFISDLIDGQIIHTLASDLPTRPQALAFSPDGKFLAAVLSEGCGLRVWQTVNWTLTTSDDPGGCSGTTDTTELRFQSKSALFTSGEGGVIRYQLEADGVFGEASRFAPNDLIQRPDSIVISPDGSQLIVADRRQHDRTVPLLLRFLRLDSVTLEPVGPPIVLSDDVYFYDAPNSPRGVQTKLNRIVWEGLGQGRTRITAGGVLFCDGVLDPTTFVGFQEVGQRSNCVARFDLSDGDVADVSFLSVGDETVVDMLRIPDHRAVAIATRNSMALYDQDGDLVVNGWGYPIEATSPFADFRLRGGGGGALLGFGVSSDGTRVQFEDYRSGAIILANTKTLTVTQTTTPQNALMQPDIDPNFFGPVDRWLDASQVDFGGPDMLLENDRLRAVAAFAKGDKALVGTADSIQIIDLKTQTPLCRQRVTSEAFRVNLALDDSLAIVGHADGTLRWYDIQFNGDTCRLGEQLALNIRRSISDANTWTWQAWIKETGQFASDLLAKQDMKWLLTGQEGDLDLTGFEDVAELYDKNAIRDALERSQKTAQIKRDPVLAQQAEAARAIQIKMTSPRGKRAVLKEPTVKLSLRIKGAGSWPRTVDVLVAGRVSVHKKTKTAVFAPGEKISVEKPGSLQVEIELPKSARARQGEMDLCFAVDGVIQKPCEKLAWAGEIIKKPKPRLFAVLVGFSDYTNGRLGSLDFAQNDALDLARLIADDALRAQDNHALADFESVSIDLIVAPSSDTARQELNALAALPNVTVHPANAASISNVLQKLTQRDKNEELANDIVLFSYSGHGTSVPLPGAFGSDRSTWLLDPNAPEKLSSALVKGAAVSVDHLLARLADISAEQLVLIDACRSFLQVASQSTVDPGLENVLIAARANPSHVVFSAREGQFSPEGDEFVYSNHRPAGQNGNGVFTYAILDALTNEQADIIPGDASKGRIEIIELKTHLMGFFSGQADDFFKRIKESRPRFIAPQPIWIPKGGADRPLTDRTYLRTLTKGG